MDAEKRSGTISKVDSEGEEGQIKKIGEDHLRGELQEERRCSILVFNFSGEERRKEEGRTGG